MLSRKKEPYCVLNQELHCAIFLILIHMWPHHWIHGSPSAFCFLNWLHSSLIDRISSQNDPSSTVGMQESNAGQFCTKSIFVGCWSWNKILRTSGWHWVSYSHASPSDNCIPSVKINKLVIVIEESFEISIHLMRIVDTCSSKLLCSSAALCWLCWSLVKIKIMCFRQNNDINQLK